MSETFVRQQTRECGLITELAAEQLLLDGHLEVDPLEIPFWNLNGLGTTREQHTVQASSGNPLRGSADGPSFLAVAAHHDVAMLEGRHRVSPISIADFKI